MKLNGEFYDLCDECSGSVPTITCSKKHCAVKLFIDGINFLKLAVNIGLFLSLSNSLSWRIEEVEVNNLADGD